MGAILNQPLLTLLCLLPALSFATWCGSRLRARHGAPPDETLSELNMVLTTVAALLGLIIGSTFSMALGRYDQRKN